jgi:hypothetical protein
MTSYLPWLLLLLLVACPLMMVFMMRGMTGGRNTSHDAHDKDADRGGQSTDPTETDPAWTTSADGEDRARIAQLERELADLRAPREQPTGRNPTNPR